MAKSAPYLVGDKWTLDADIDDKVFYTANVTQWLIDNATSVASFDLVVDGVTVLAKGLAQGDRGGLLPAKLQVMTTPANPSCTWRVTTADGQQFDKTMYFNRVQN